MGSSTTNTLPETALSDTAGTRLLRHLAHVRKERFLLFLVLPGVLYYIIFHYFPMYGVIIAFKDYSIRKGIIGSDWVGFKNFASFFRYPHILRLVRNTFLLSFYSLIFGFPAPIIFALLLNEVRGRLYKRTVQTVSFFPHFIAMPAAVGMFFLILSPRGGFINQLLVSLFNMKPIYFMLEPGWFRPIYILSGIWQGFGWGAIVYIAQLSRIDPQLYEAATIDGCSRVRKMWHVSLPGLKPMISIFLILRMGGLLSVGYEKVILMYNEMTFETADVIGSFVYRRGLAGGAWGLGTAVGFLNSAIALILVLTANRIAKRLSEWTLL